MGTPSGSATVNLRMPGQYYDAESGLFYNWNRYYNPAIGRYISSDPIGQEGGINTFLYAESSPVMFIDPEGLIGPDDMDMPGYEPPIGPNLYFGTGSGRSAFSSGPKTLPQKSNTSSQTKGDTAKGSSQSGGSCPAPDYVVSSGGTVFPVPRLRTY